MDAMDEAWKEAKAPAGEELPAGRYVVEIEEVRRTKTRDGYEMLLWAFRVVEGDHAGAACTKASVVKPGPAMDWLKKDLRTCGLEPATLGEMREALSALPGLRVEVRRVAGKNGDLQTFINRRVAEGGEKDGVPY